jgi:hypothetical protein
MSLEFIRHINQDTYIVFPLIDADGDTVNGASNLDSEYVQYDDDGSPVAFGDCNFEAQELGATGVYYLHLLAAEVNAVYIEVQIKSDEAKTQHLAIRTVAAIPTPAEIAESVWEELLADHQTSDTFGLIVQMIFQTAYMQRTMVYATIPIVAQGITDILIDAHCYQYMQIDISVTRNFVAPDFTYYILYHYDANGNADIKKPSLGTVW